MAYVVKEDMIASIDNTININQGDSNIYEITLHRDFIGNQLNAKKVSVISVGILNSAGKKVLMYNAPFSPGVSDILSFADSSANTPGVIKFEINEAQSRALAPGDLNVQVTLVFADFFPNAKTYVLPPIKIGQVIEVVQPGGTTGGTTGGSPSQSLLNSSPIYTIEYVNASNPTSYGKMSVNSSDPSLITEMTFKNLDSNKTRNTILENFVINRMDNDKIRGVITIYDMKNPRFYSIYRIEGWSRVDILQGNGNYDDNDGIKINVTLESTSKGPGVSKTSWNTGDSITFSIDTYGIVNAPTSRGILTFVDKNLRTTRASNGNSSPTGVFISNSPYYDSYVMVEVNGISVEVGSDKENSTVYFSGNNGVTSVEIEAIRAGDQLIWNSIVAGFELEIGDDINLIYEADVDDLR